MHMKGASGSRQIVMHDPGVQHSGQMFFYSEAILEREGKQSTRGKTLMSG